MQIPTEWYIHIIPGLILLLSVLPLLANGKIIALRQKFPSSIKDLLGTSIILGIVGFILGFVGNAVGLTVLKPALTWIGLIERPTGSVSAEQWYWLISTGKLDLAREISSGYQQLILLRSMFGAFLFLTLASIVGLIWRKDYRLWRIATTLVLIISTWGIWDQWLAHRASQYQFQVMVLRSLGF